MNKLLCIFYVEENINDVELNLAASEKSGFVNKIDINTSKREVAYNLSNSKKYSNWEKIFLINNAAIRISDSGTLNVDLVNFIEIAKALKGLGYFGTILNISPASI